MKIKIAVVDDHDLFREGLKLVLNQINEFVVIFDSADGNQFIEFLLSNKPEIVLMDINMPAINGIETTIKALKICPELKIIALTMFSDLFHYSQMINAGAKGFVLKNAKKYELQRAITEVFNEGSYFSQDIIKQLVFTSNKTKENLSKLTHRELDVLNLVCTGATSQEIADKLFISVKTVETHRTNIFSKANVKNTAELIIWAVKNNYFTIE